MKKTDFIGMNVRVQVMIILLLIMIAFIINYDSFYFLKGFDKLLHFHFFRRILNKHAKILFLILNLKNFTYIIL